MSRRATARCRALTLAVENYRSLRGLVTRLGALTVVSGANGTGKSSLYPAMRVLADHSCAPPLLCERRGAAVRPRGADGTWTHETHGLRPYDSMLSELADPYRAPDLLTVRELLRSWRFYDHVRAHSASPSSPTAPCVTCCGWPRC